MKKSVSVCGVLLLMLLGIGCGTTEKKSENDAAAFDTLSAPVFSGNTAMGVTQTVKDYANWLHTYDSLSEPGSRLSVYANPDDPNLVTVFDLTRSHAYAKSHFTTDAMKHALMEAGAGSDPEYHFYDIKYINTDPTTKLYRVAVAHDVEDYQRWRKVFDQDEPIRAKANLELRAISVDADDSHKVYIMFATENIEKAKEVINSDELRQRMKEAGVRSEPLITVLKTLAKNN